VLEALKEASERGSHMLTVSRLEYTEKYSSLEIINKSDIEHIKDLDEYDQLAQWASVPRTRTHILESIDIDLIWFDQVVRQLGVQVVESGVEITTAQTRKNYYAGTTYGNMNLKRIGISGILGEVPADWRAIDALKVRNLSALRGITQEVNKVVIRELTDGISIGESIPKLAKRISTKVDTIGIHRATVMARTEAINAFTIGSELRYAQAGIEEISWLTASDDRVCSYCGPLDGKVFRIDSRHERPPLHPQCRCAILPVLE